MTWTILTYATLLSSIAILATACWDRLSVGGE
jgi:hypothetical protein